MSPTILAGDVNHDGNIDMITANATDGTVSVLLGDGTGSFSPAPDSPLSMASVTAIAMKDLNGDGNPDLVMCNYASVAIFIGDGTGRFTRNPETLSTISPTDLISIADFTGDGKLDLIAWGAGSGNLFQGDGNGGFSFAGNEGVTSLTQLLYGNVAVADFNGDGRMDVAVTPEAGGSSGLVVSGGFGNGSFAPLFHESVGSESRVTLAPSGVGDFNGDGKSDILAFHALTAITYLWTGNTSLLTAFNREASSITMSPTCVVVGDFNGDGKLDWAGLNQNASASGVFVYFGDGTGKFVQSPGSPYAVPGTLLSLASGDFNGDGRTDLAVHTSNSVVILLNTQTNAPLISQGGVVPVYSRTNTIQPGSWISIFGAQLAENTVLWNNDFPQSLGGVSVTIDDKPGYLWYVSPTQINLQAPDDTPGSTVKVVVSNSHGSATSAVTLAPQSPSFSLLDSTHVAGIILTPDGSGAYGNGTYDIVGPPGAFAYKTRPVKRGEVIELFGVGFGATSPPVSAGMVPAGAAPTANKVQISIGGVQALVSFSGITAAGLYQFNVTVPAATSGERALIASINGVETTATITLQ